MIEEGIRHITDLSGYDHLLFILALIAPYRLRDWKKWAVLVTLFTIGHSVSLITGHLNWLHFDSNWIEFLIPVTIFITAAYNGFFRQKFKKDHLGIEGFFTVFFGLIHGFGFSGYFGMIVHRNRELLDLFLFNIGIELGQLIIVTIALIIGYLLLMIPGMKLKFWTYGLSLIAIILSVQLIAEKWVF